MAFERNNEDYHVIAKLDDEPNDVSGMSAVELKARFDQAAVALQNWINTVLLKALETNGAANIGIEVVPGLVGATTVQTALAALYEQILNVSQGSVSDGSINEAKLADGAVTLAKMAAGVLAAANISGLADVATSGNYNDLNNIPAPPSIPTLISAFQNDSGYLTSVASGNIQNKAVTEAKLADAVKALFAPANGYGTTDPSTLATGKAYFVYE